MSNFAVHSINDAGKSDTAGQAFGMCLGRAVLAVAFFLVIRLRLGRVFFVKSLWGRVAGRLRYWRGNVFAGGVCKQGMAGVNVEQSGGALRGAVVEGGKGGKDGSHFVPRVRRARRLVVAAPGWDRYALPTCLRQCVVDGLGVLPGQNNRAGVV